MTPFGDVTPERILRDRQRRQEAAKRYADRQAQKQRQKPRERRQRAEAPASRPTRKARRNDAPWRAACIALYGEVCIVPGCSDRAIEMDHLKPRSQGGLSVVENGIPLCGAWSRTVDGGHHGMKTAGELQFAPEWLTKGQRAYLASIGWVDWDEDGKPFGEGWRHFTERSSR